MIKHFEILSQAWSNGSQIQAFIDGKWEDISWMPQYWPSQYKYRLKPIKKGIKMAKHKHYDVIIAYANGAEIQYLIVDEVWKDTKNPLFYEDVEYRVKPKPKVKKWRWVMWCAKEPLDSRISSRPASTAEEAEFYHPKGYKAIYAIPESMVEVEED